MTKPIRTQMAVLSGERGGSHINVTGVLSDSVTPQYLKGYKPENMTGILTWRNNARLFKTVENVLVVKIPTSLPEH